MTGQAPRTVPTRFNPGPLTGQIRPTYETPGTGVTVTIDSTLPTTSGFLTGDETWSGTVTLTGDVTVPSGVSLTIDSGNHDTISGAQRRPVRRREHLKDRADRGWIAHGRRQLITHCVHLHVRQQGQGGLVRHPGEGRIER